MTNQNNELDDILDVLYMQGEDTGKLNYGSAVHQITAVNGAKQAIQALYAPLKKQQNVNTSTEHVKPVNMSLRQAIQDLEFYTKDGEAIDFIHPEHLEHLDKIMELFNKYTESVDLTKPEVNKPTLRDVVDGTPKGQQAVSEALERSAETMNNTVKKAVQEYK